MVDQYIGRTIRGYKLTERIGVGGFGAVYRAQQDVVGREVAVKVILPQHANSPGFVRRFDTEAQFVARLEHPHIVPLFDYWRDPEGAYLVMRYVGGGSLGEVIHEKRMPLDEVARVLDEITAALSVAHRSGVAHLDLKPDNILLDEDGNTYLTDFGIAKKIDAETTDEDRHVSGTVAYASPEQLQAEPLTAQSDVYSLGIILYEMLTGEHPFEGKNITGMIYSHITEELPDLSEYRPDLHPAFERVIRQATAKEPDERFEDVRDLAMKFRRALRLHQGSPVDDDKPRPTPEFVRNPYKGLRPFEEADASRFFGRESTIEQLTEHLADSRFLAVVGPSGSGKSSLVKAGLLPALRTGVLEGSDSWFMAEMVPGSDPLNNLASALNSVATRSTPAILERLEKNREALHALVTDLLADKDGDLLLVIDQFEEVFTQLADVNEREHFLDLIQYAVTQPGTRLRVVVTLRADFYDRPLGYEVFGALVQQNTEVVLPLSAAELERAIIGPVEQLGITVDADLVATVIADVRQEPGALPLLQYALTELFERREGARLTLAAYRNSGGVSGALAKRAEEMFVALPADLQTIARQVFLRLVTLGEGEEDTRRRARYSELMTLATRERVQTVLDAFGQYRLLTFDTDPDTREPLVEIAHEALIREWKRFRRWLDESREDIRFQRALEQAANDWRANRKDTSYLLRGARLAQLEEWAAETDLELAAREQTFLEASIAERERLAELERKRQVREAQLEERAQRRMRWLSGVMAIAAALSIGLSVFALNRSQAEIEARATSEANAEIANVQADIAATAQQIAQEEAELAEASAARAAEEASRAQSLALSAAAQLALLDNELDTAVALALAANNVDNPPSQSRLVMAQVAYSPGTRHLFEIGTGVDAVAMDGDGRTVVTAARDGTLALWDLRTGEALQSFEGHADRVSSVALSGNGRRLLSGSWDDTAILWDATTGERLATFAGHADNVLDVALSERGLEAATASSDGTVRLWNIRSGQQVATFEGHQTPVYAVDISPDRRFVISGGADNTVRVWDIETGAEVAFYGGHGGRVNAVDYSSDGANFLSASEDGTVRVLETPDANQRVLEPLRTLQGHDGGVLDAAFTAEGDEIISASEDETARLWNWQQRETVQIFQQHENAVLSVAATRDGRFAVTGSADGTVRVWVADAATALQEIDVRGTTNPVLDINPEGNRWVYGAGGAGRVSLCGDGHVFAAVARAR